MGFNMPFLILVVWTLVEIALFVAVGGAVGILGTVGLVLLAGLAGVLILRGRLARLPVLLRAGADPAALLAGGAMTALGAGLLILPGFLSDAVGLVLLLPPVQRGVAARLARRGGRATAAWHPTIIEGDYTVHDPASPPRDRLPGP